MSKPPMLLCPRCGNGFVARRGVDAASLKRGKALPCTECVKCATLEVRKLLDRKVRVIDYLRKKFPGKWTYDGYGRYSGEHFDVQGYSQIVNADLDQFTTVYRRSDTGAEVYIPGHSDKMYFA